MVTRVKETRRDDCSGRSDFKFARFETDWVIVFFRHPDETWKVFCLLIYFLVFVFCFSHWIQQVQKVPTGLDPL